MSSSHRSLRFYYGKPSTPREPDWDADLDRRGLPKKLAYVSHDMTVEKKVMLKHGDVPHVSQLAVATLKPTEVATKHSHKDMTETFCFQSGTGEMEVDGVIHTVGAGTTITVYPNEEHEIRNTGSENLVVLYFGIMD